MMKSLRGALLLAASLCLLSVGVSAQKVSNRSLIINNYCGKTVWFRATAGSAPFSRAGIYQCATDADCMLGSNCWARVGTPLCFWDIPTPQNKNFRVEAGGQNRLDFPVVPNGQDVVWSGNVVGCLDGTCADSATVCDAQGCGVSGAVNMAEFTLAQHAVDFYDVSIINGVNIPMELSPILPSDFHLNGNDPYRCGNPGGNQMITGTPSSTWVFDIPNIEYNWVSKGGASCASDADCVTSSVGTKCGLSDNVGESKRYRLTCGKFMGYWTANQVCGADPSFGAPFYCSKPLTNAQSAPGLTLWNMMGCVGNGVDSCYQQSADSACCGCVNWDRVDSVKSSPLTEQCVNTNPEWTANILPQLQWLKKACPTCYTYPYDDMSSTFVCSDADPSTGQENNLAYELNFCPNNKPVKAVASAPTAFNATIVNGDFTATIKPAAAGGATVSLVPNSAMDWVIFNYAVSRAGQTTQAVQSSLQMVYSTVTKSWTVALPDPGAGSQVAYTFNYLISPKVTTSYALAIPAAVSTPVTRPVAAPPAPKFVASIIPNTNVTNGAIGVNIQFNTTNTAAKWVILHYNINNGAAQNVQMGLNTALSSTVWNFFAPYQLVNGTAVTYSFTYMLTNAGAVDSAVGTWVYVALPPPAPVTVPSTVGSGSTSGSTTTVTPPATTTPVTSVGATTPAVTTPTATYTYSYVPGAWSACDCTGKQTRTFTCKRNDGVESASSFCSGSTPATTGSCTLPTTCQTAGQAPGSVVTTTDFTVQHAFAPSTSTDVILFTINPSINLAATWVVLHYKINGGGDNNVAMNAVSGSSSYSYSVPSFGSSASLSYSFTYFLNGWGARDSATFTYSAAPATAALQSAALSASDAGYVNSAAAPEVASVGNSSANTMAIVIAVLASVVALAASAAAGYAYRHRLFGQKTMQAASAPVVKEMELTPSNANMAPLASPSPADELLSPTYRQEEEAEQRLQYAATQGVARRTSV